MKSFRKFLAEQAAQDALLERLTIALEHQTYKNIPGTQSSYRIDSPNTNTRTQRHAHVYARASGGGKQLYAVNADGSGHDGSSGIAIPASHAEFLRAKGFDIPTSLTLESLEESALSPELYEICILEDDA